MQNSGVIRIAVCERGNSQVVPVDSKLSPSILALSVASHKLSTEFRLVAFHREPNSKGFFASAVTTTKDSLLKSAGCGVKIGDSLPLCYCLANLVEVSRNLCRLSGKMSSMRIELTRHAHLVSGNRYGAGSTRLVSIAPLSKLYAGYIVDEIWQDEQEQQNESGADLAEAWSTSNHNREYKMATDEKTMRTPFPAHQISKLPKPTKAQTDEVKSDFQKGIRCTVCGGWHHPKVVHLDYVGHAALTDRLLDVDLNWTWEPLALDSDGLPAIDKDGGMWIRLTVGGVTRLGYGDAQGKAGGDAMKERIGDALRNAAMRFGAALDLWHKGDLHIDEPEGSDKKPASGVHKPTDNPAFNPSGEELEYLNIVCMEVVAKLTAIEMSEYLESLKLDSDEKTWVWSKLDSKTRSGIKKANEERRLSIK